MSHHLSLRTNQVEVIAEGVVHAPYDRAFFSITISEVAETSSMAKAAMREIVQKVETYIDAAVKKGIFKNKVKALRVDPHYVHTPHHERKHQGYKVGLNFKFETESVELVSEIQDALTEFPKSEVEAVRYGFRDIETLRERALEQAWKNVQARWRKELALSETFPIFLAGTNKENLWTLNSWDVDYKEHEPLSKFAAPVDDNTPGLAVICVVLGVLFEKSTVK